MTVVIKPKRGSGTPSPVDLEISELAYDATNRRLFTRSGLSVVEIGVNPQKLDVDDLNIDNNTISVTTTDTDLNLTPNGTGVVNVNGNLSMDAGYGSVAPVFGVRAWCHYDGDNQVLQNSGNISSVTYRGSGQYIFNFATPMPDSNYAAVISIGEPTWDLPNVENDIIPKTSYHTTTDFSVNLEGTGSEYRNWTYTSVIIVR